MDTDEATILYKVRKTVFQLLRDRGYIVSDQSCNQSLEDFKANFNGSRESLNMLFSKPEATNESQMSDAIQVNENKILVFYPADDKVGSNVIK